MYLLKYMSKLILLFHVATENFKLYLRLAFVAVSCISIRQPQSRLPRTQSCGATLALELSMHSATPSPGFKLTFSLCYQGNFFLFLFFNLFVLLYWVGVHCGICKNFYNP
jgi:hypothetical protein